MDSSSDNESVSSDKELQIAFAQGLLKPGLNVEGAAPPKPIKNVSGLQQALADLKKNLPWSESLDLTNEMAPAPRGVGLNEEDDELTGDIVHDDFKREMRFYRQAQGAVTEALPKLQSLNIPTRRPDDYFAEMAKSDSHMKKVREKLLSKQMALDRSEKARKMRELRKYGKKVQQDVLKERQQQKKKLMNAVKKYRKGTQEKAELMQEIEGKHKGGKGKQTGPPGKRREYKNKKFGFGGQKKRSKYNTKSSASETSDFSVKKHSAGKFKKGKKGNQNRPGKKRRQKMKNSRK